MNKKKIKEKVIRAIDSITAGVELNKDTAFLFYGIKDIEKVKSTFFDCENNLHLIYV